MRRLFLQLAFGILFYISYSFAHTCRGDLGGEIKPEKIEFNMDMYVAKVRELAKNPIFLPALRYLKEYDGGTIKRVHAAAIAAIVAKFPMELKAWTSFASLVRHYGDHGAELGINNYVDYEYAAKTFANKDSETSIIIPQIARRGWGKYDLKTMEYLVVDESGHIITYFKVTHHSTVKHFIYFLDQYISNSGYRWARDNQN